MARRSGRRTDYSWVNTGDLETGLDLSTTDAQFGTSSLQFTEAGTITRVRGKLAVQLDAAAVDERALILFALMVLPIDAFNASSPPEIFTGSGDEASFLWQGALWVSSLAEAAVQPNFLAASLDIDTKAMRRIKPNETLALVIHTPAELTVDQTGTYDVAYFLHVLFGS